MSSGLNVDLLISLPSQGIEYLFCPLDSSPLIGFIASPQHQVSGDSRAHKLHPEAGPDEDTHFTQSIAYGFAIAKIVFLGSIQPGQNCSFSPNIPHTVEPCIKLRRPADQISHVSPVAYWLLLADASDFLFRRLPE
jgi:hypothetical protein